MDQPGDTEPAERQDVASAPPRETDPRRFPFRITCERCREFHHTLQAKRWHLKECPGGRGVTSHAAIAASGLVPGQKCACISTSLEWSCRARTSPELPWARHHSGCSPRRPRFGVVYCLSSSDHELHITVWSCSNMVRCSIALVLPRWVVSTVDWQVRRSAFMVCCFAVVSSDAAIWLIWWLSHLRPLVSSATTGMGKVVCFAPVATVRHGRLHSSYVKCHFWQGCDGVRRRRPHLPIFYYPCVYI